MSDLLSMNYLLWGVLPYVALTLFFVVPFLRMAYRPFGLTTRASGIFLGRGTLGIAAHLLHWGIFLVFFGHLAGLIGGIRGWGFWVGAFFWMATLGGIAAILGSAIALTRRILVPEMRAMSQPDDYIVHLFLIAILGVAIYQAVFERIWGVAYTAGPWFASLWRLDPQPELMASASILSKIHIALAFLFAAYFPFTKMIHAWTLPVNYFVRPYQVMRTVAGKFRNRWEYLLLTDKSYMTYLAIGVVVVLGLVALIPGPSGDGLIVPAQARSADPGNDAPGEDNGSRSDQRALRDYPLYVNQCARCHGLEGGGDGPGAGSPTFSVRPRDLTTGRYQFVSTENGVASDADLRHVIVHGLAGTGMPAFDWLSSAQVGSLVAVLDEFWRQRPQPGARIEVPPRPAPTAAAVAEGRELYANYCTTCHGERGEGDGVLTALRTDAEGRVVPPLNLRVEPLKSGASPRQIYYRIAAGIPRDAQANEWLMPAYANLGADKIWSLIAYLEAEILPPGQVRAARLGD